MPSDTYILTISEAGVSVPSSHASTHLTGGSDPIPVASTSTSGLMSAAMFDQHVTNTAKVSNITHTGDVTDTAGVLTVNKINGVSMAGLATGIVKNTTGTGAPSIAVAADFPTLNQNTTGNAATATYATTAGSATTASKINGVSMAELATGILKNTTGIGEPSIAVAADFPILNQNTTGNAATASVAALANYANSAGSATTASTAAYATFAGSVASAGTANEATTAINAELAQKAINVVGGTAKSLVYQTGVDATGFIPLGLGGKFLKSNGGDLEWSSVDLANIDSIINTLPVSNGGTGVTTSTGSGKNVLSNSPTLVTPILGTPTLGTLTNCTGLPLTTGVTGVLPIANGGTGSSTGVSLTAGVNGVLPIANGGTGSSTGVSLTSSVSGVLPVANGGTGATTSTGTGDTVRATSPTLVTPLLGTPTSGVLTNCTGLPLTTGVTGILPIANGGTGTSTGVPTIPLATGVSGILAATNGGTGQSSYAVGDILFASTSTALSKLAGVATGNALISGGVGSAPSYGKIGLTTHVSDTLPVANGGTGVTTSTGTGANVLATSPTLVTPILGTPTSGTLTNCTGLPLTTGVTGILPVANGGTGSSTGVPLTTGVTGILPIANGGTGSSSGVSLTTGVTGTLPVANGGTGVTTSTGTGANVQAISPILVTPILGTPTSGTLTNCTGLPLTTGVTGVLPVANGGTGVEGPDYAEYYFTTTGNITTIPTADDFYKIEGTSTVDHISLSFDMPVLNELHYSGPTRMFLVTISCSLRGNNGDIAEVAVAKNGSHIDSSISRVALRGTASSVTCQAQCMTQLGNFENLSAYVKNVAATNDIIFDKLNVCVHPLV